MRWGKELKAVRMSYSTCPSAACTLHFSGVEDKKYCKRHTKTAQQTQTLNGLGGSLHATCIKRVGNDDTNKGAQSHLLVIFPSIGLEGTCACDPQRRAKFSFQHIS
jgi:hypothetical protein